MTRNLRLVPPPPIPRRLPADLKDFRADPQEDAEHHDGGMIMLAYAVIYGAVVMALCMVAALYSGIVQLPTPDLRGPDYSTQHGARS